MDMISLLTDFDDNKIDSRYRLVLIAAQRARQMMQGSSPVINSKFVKEPSVALEEVLQGRTEFLTGVDAKAAYKEAMMARTLEARRKREAERLGPQGQTEPGKDAASPGNDKPAGESPALVEEGK